MMDVKTVLAQFEILKSRNEVIVECESVTELKSESGIYLGQPSIVYDRPNNGVVIKKTPVVTDVDVGDKVHFDITKGIDLCKFEGKWYILLKVEDILGKEIVNE